MGTEYLAESRPSRVGTGEKPACPNTNVPQIQGKLAEKDYSFLLKEVRTLFELTPKDSIYEFMAVSLNNLLRGSIVLVNSFNEASNTLHVRAVAGLGTYVDKIICMLGSHPIDIAVPMNDDARKGLGSGRLKKVSGIYELATGTVPRIVCISIENILNIGSTYAMGITWRDKIMGSVAILAQDEIENPAVIETFIDFSAVAIRRWLGDDKARQQLYLP